MAAKKKAAPVDPFQEYEQRLGKLEEQLQDLDEGVAHNFMAHDDLIDGLREDLARRRQSNRRGNCSCLVYDLGFCGSGCGGSLPTNASLGDSGADFQLRVQVLQFSI